MSISQLRSEPRVSGLLAASRGSVTSAGEVAIGTVGIEELAEAIALAGTWESQAAALRLAELLRTKYAAVREAYAAGRIRADQVRVIVNAAEQAPERATDDQLAQAEELMVAKATGEATRSGRPMNATRRSTTTDSPGVAAGAPIWPTDFPCAATITTGPTTPDGT